MDHDSSNPDAPGVADFRWADAYCRPMDQLANLQTSLKDRYTIEREIGRGGMATVFLARDLRHDRRVALKLLDPELGAVLGVERFLSEIRVTANLQHPNLLALFDSGAADGLLYYVMPFIEGESLRARLDRERQLPVDEAVRIGIAIASALDYAHRHGVIHRDLKPENVLLHEGQPLVADFGIALAVSNAGGQRVTQTGLSLGTPQYMSPEQATGDRAIDGRTDIYSLGAVIYEMLAGEPPHSGGTAQAVIARLVTEKPRALRESRSSVPEHVEWAVAHALEKLSADRFATAREFADALEGRSFVKRAAGEAGRKKQGDRRVLAAAVVSGLLMLAAGIGIAQLRSPTALISGADVVRFAFTPPPNQRFTNNIPGFGVSPDGRAIAYRALAPDGTGLLFVRSLDDVEPKLVKGVTNPNFPFFSPDGKWIAFWVLGLKANLMKVPVDGGTPILVASGIPPSGAVWTPDDEIILGFANAGLSRVSASGRVPKVLTRINPALKERAHRHPILLTDKRTIIFSVTDSVNATQLALTTTEGDTPRYLGVIALQAIGVVAGHLIYISRDGQVLAAPFNNRTASVGPPIRMIDHVAVGGNRADIALSPSGTLVHDAGHGVQLLTIVDERGITRLVMDSLRSYRFPRFSPDGRKIAVMVTEQGNQAAWIYDVSARTFERVTDPQIGASFPEWTADGKALVVTAAVSGRQGVFRVPLDGRSEPELLTGAIGASEPAPDGRHLLISDGRQVIYREIGDTAKGTIAKGGVTIATEAGASGARMSPDGKWVAYHSEEAGTFQIYVRPFPALNARYQISVDGGQAAVWSRDSKRLVYSAAGRALIAATIRTLPSFAIVRRDTLFAGQHEYATAHANYDLSPDGKQLLLVSANPNGYWMVVRHWDTELKRRIAGR